LQKLARSKSLDNNGAANSNLQTPAYSNSTLNSKGFSFNPTPFERFDNSADYVRYNNGAYDSARYSISTDKDVKDNKSLIKKALQEENKALGGKGPGQSFTGTMAGS